MIISVIFFVINCFGYQNEPNAFDLFMFGLGSFVVISLLLWYYSKIPISNFKENDIQIEITRSRWPKFLAYILFIIPAIIFVIELFNFGNLFTSFDVFMLSSLVSLFLYLNITPEVKKIVKRKLLDNPIYQTKDILLQSSSSDANFMITQSTTSAWVKILAFILIAFVVIIPVDQLFSSVNSFY
ncbi:hypothetical protein [uncultured Polaribacter sp.]|uniref:hypothetical protein n=1 Tax=uncultured Polaribacter sp. TaxID=174711 RepID=UPI0030DCC26F|tara:strand:+ start:190 stop:741 length:552 start_codon:yes stop_codon:yes gene_type:complete